MPKILFFLILSSLIINSFQINHCLEESNGICNTCELGYYLTNNICIDSFLSTVFHNCKESKDGLSCSTCEDGYFFSKNGECVNTQNCQLSQKRLSYCEKCDEGFYLSKNGLFCSSSQNCIYGDRETGKCTDCQGGYYIDLNDNHCKSNTENNQFKNCKKGAENCEECIYKYYLGEDGLCSLSRNCSVSNQDGQCLKCVEGFYLSSYDKKCTNVQDCFKVDNNFQCEECGTYILLNSSSSECSMVTTWEHSVLLNCKVTDETGLRCKECKKNYFLNLENNLCVLNKYMERFKNCAFSDASGEYCQVCEEGYYLGTEDKICTQTYGCAVSENNICQKCSHSFCLNSKKECIPNNIFNNLIYSVYYKCRFTNSEDSQCHICEDGFIEENGKCYDFLNCKEISNGNCMKCMKNYCLNNVRGCINTNVENCERCNDNDLSKCTGCEEGFRLDEENNLCVKCKEGCATCSDDNNCGSCSSGYFEKKGESIKGTYDVECSKCIEGCKVCEDESSCVSCNEGYYISKESTNNENLVCFKCPEGCTECLGLNTCLKCDEGYFLTISGNITFCMKFIG